MPTSASTVFIVDDDASVRKGLSRILQSAGWKVEAFSSASDFLARPAFTGTGCVVLDVRMPGMMGPELRDRLAARKIHLPIIFLTGHGDIPTGVDAIKRGAVDFLTKPVDEDVLLPAVQFAMERHRTAQIQATELETLHQRLADLSDREREVLEFVIGGHLNKQIAASLGIAEKTVKVHRGRMMHKMNVISVAQLVHLCDAAGVSSRRLAAD